MNDVTSAQVLEILDAGDVYREASAEGHPLAGKSVALLFEKPSLRTKVSFEVATYELGGHPIYMSREEVGMGTRETAEDIARVLERWVSVIVARVFQHDSLRRLAESSAVPVVNALSDVEHPCQALADLLTMRQRLGALKGATVAVIGDANNCALSLALGCAAVGAQFRIAAPVGYGFGPEDLASINQRYGGNGMRVQTVANAQEAVRGADVVYTDVWTSMGQEHQAEERYRDFAGYQVSAELMAHAGAGAILMHPMPAHYGEELAEGMLDHPQSAAYDQAENRLHVQKAVLRLLVVGA